MPERNTTAKIDLRHRLLRGILDDLASEFGCSVNAMSLRYYRNQTAVVKRVTEEAEKRLAEAKDVEDRHRRIMEALAA